MRVTRQLATRDTQQAKVVSQLWQQRESTFKDRSEWMPEPVVRQMLTDPTRSCHLLKTNLRR